MAITRFLLKKMLTPKALLSCATVVSLALILARLLIGGGLPGGDSITYYSSLRAIVLEHSLNLENSYNYFHNDHSKFTGLSKFPYLTKPYEPTGRYLMHYPIGVVISWTPFFLLGQLAAQIYSFCSGDYWSLTGFSMIQYFFTASSAVFYAMLGLFFIYHYLIRYEQVAKSTALLAVLSVGLGTSLTYYIYFIPTYSHVVSFFWSSSLLIYFLKCYRSKLWTKRSFLLLGFLTAMTALTRYQDIGILLVPLTILLFDWLREKKMPIALSPLNLSLAILTCFTAFIPQLLINKYLAGSYWESGYVGETFAYLTNPQLGYVLFSPLKGLFIITPLILFAIIGLCTRLKNSLYLGLFIFFLAELYLTSAWYAYHQGESYGIRMLIVCSIAFIFGLIPVLNKLAASKKYWPYIFSVIFIAINWLLMVLYALRVFGSDYSAYN